MSHILKVVAYLPIIMLIYYVIRKDWYAYEENIINKCIQIKTILISSIVIGLYSLSYNRTFWWADVTYYDRLFCNGLTIPESPGLNLIYYILHMFTCNTDILLFTVSATACLIMLFSYRIYDEAEPSCILFLLLSIFFIETCQVNLKQGVACGLASIFFAEIMKKGYVSALALAIIATLFHVTAGPILLISFFVVWAININNRLVKIIVLSSVIISLFRFDALIEIIGRMGSFIPGLNDKLLEYTSPSGIIESDTTLLVVFKGIPYYLISIVGLYDRKFYKDEIAHYDSYLAISFLASVSYVMSGFSYWMSRVINYYWMTDFVFFGLLLSKMENTNNRLIIRSWFILMMFVLTFRELIQIYILQL